MKCGIFIFTIIGMAEASRLRRNVQAKLRSRVFSSTVGLPLDVAECSTGAGCTTSTKYAVIDQNWLWYTTDPTGSSSCDLSSGGDLSKCELVQPTDYTSTYGITTSGSELYLPYLSPTGGTGSRLYLMDADSNYTTFQMLGKEISFDVETSSLKCGFNGAVYFVEMDADGGKSSGTQGAEFGTGYCDAQCPSDLKTTTTGAANSDGQSVCCNEMDLWEANKEAAAITAHPCSRASADLVGPYVCSDNECDSSSTSGVCDGSGCDFNSYRNGDTTFYGPGSNYAVDSTKTMTVTTQFHTDQGGELSEIVQLFTVDGAVINQRSVTIGGSTFDSITTDYCTAEDKAYSGSGTFSSSGGLGMMGRSLDRGMVLVMSLWNDPTSHMLWLDGTSGTGDGSVRGPCGTTDDSQNSSSESAAGVTYSNFKFGDLDSTYDKSSTSAPTTPSGPTAAPTAAATCTNGAAAQCAYGSFSEPQCCASGFVCCDNGATAGSYASCQQESYCLSSACETDGGRSSACTIVDQ